MQLRITPRQEHRTTIHSRIFVREWREWDDLGTLGPPIGKEVGIDEAEGVVHRDGDALAER